MIAAAVAVVALFVAVAYVIAYALHIEETTAPEED